jgi:hypothetical protein
MTSGGGGFETGDDYIATRLSIDVPENVAPGLREITQEAERLRTTLEAVTRTDMVNYLNGMENAARRAAEAQANLTEQLQSYLALASRGESPSMVPLGTAIDPFRAVTHGMGTAGPGQRPPDPADVSNQIAQMRETNPREWLNMQQARGMVTPQDVVSISPQSIQEQANAIAEREQAMREQVLKTDTSAQAREEESRTGTYPSEGNESYDQMANRVLRGSSLAGRVLNEMGPGGSMLSMGRAVLGGINWARRKYSGAPDRARGAAPAEEEGTTTEPFEEGAGGTGAASEAGEIEGGAGLLSKIGGLAGIARFAGPIGAGLTALIGGFEAVQKGGQVIQGLRNQAAVRGGAAGEGMQVEMRARMLAMNPFISQEQARQIYQSVMSEGYADASGAGADNVVDFMKTNLTNLNMSVADSAKLLRNTIVGEKDGDPQSVNAALGQLRQELDTIRTVSRGTALSTPEFTQGAMDLKNRLIAAGAPAEAAGQAAIGEESEFGTDQVLKGQMARGAGDLASSAAGNALIRQFGGLSQLGLNIPGNLLPQMTTAYILSQPGGKDLWQKAADNTLSYFAAQAARGYRGDEATYLNSVYYFQLYVRSIEPDQSAATNLDACKQLFNKLTGITEPGGDTGSPPPGGGGGADSPGLMSFASGAGGGPRSAPSPAASGGGGGRGGGGGTQTINTQGSVAITLTPEAQRLLAVKGPNPAPLTSTQEGANRGDAGVYLNGSS